MIVQRIEKSPTCPEHPGSEVEMVFSPPTHAVGVWVCGACNRSLGLGTFHGWMHQTPWPQGRRPKPSEPPWRVLDLGWLFSRSRVRP